VKQLTFNLSEVFKVRETAFWNPDFNGGQGGEFTQSLTDLDIIRNPGQSKHGCVFGALLRTLLNSEESNLDKLTMELCAKISKEYDSKG